MKKKIFAFVFFLLAISIFTLNSFALSPPTITSVIPLQFSGPLSQDAANKAFSLVIYQQQSGSFNDLVPLLLRRSGSQSALVLVCKVPTSSVTVSLAAGAFVFTGTSNANDLKELVLTSEGYAIVAEPGTNYLTGSFSSSIVLGYASGSANLWTQNTSYTYGSATGLDAPYTLWSQYYHTIVQYEITVENARTEGYDEGYALGEQAGYTNGYNNGVGVGYQQGQVDGYNTGFDEGYDEGYGVGFDDGVASVPPGSGSDPVVTATVNFYNGDLQLIPSVLVTNGTDLRFWDKEYLAQAFQEGYVLYNYQFDVLQSQLQSGSSIRFKIPDNVLQAFPNLTWPVVTVAESDPLFARLEVWLYSDSYDAGYQSGIQDGDMILDGIAGIATAPVDGLRAALDFEIFGLNVGAVAIGCVAVALILIAWRFIRKIIPV